MGELDLVLGPFVIGGAFSIFLAGIMLTQCYTYLTRFPNDPSWMKYMVLYFLVMDLVHTGIETAVVYDYTITDFGNFPAIQTATKLFTTIPTISVAISSPAQCFFAWRVSRLTRVSFLGYLIVLLAVVQLFCGIGASIAITRVTHFVDFQKFKALIIPWLASSALCDLIITTALVWYLQRNKSGITATDDLVTKLIRSTVQTGALTFLWALLDLVIYLTQANSLHLYFNLPLSKIYTVSLMSTLNARRTHAETLHGSTAVGDRSFGNKMNPTGSTSIPVWDKPLASKTPTMNKKHRNSSVREVVPIEIEITRTVHEYTHSAVTHDINPKGGHRPDMTMTAFDDEYDTGSYEMDHKHARMQSELDMSA